MSDRKDDRKKDKGGHGDRAKEGGEPGGENPENHPFDKEVHPADESARSATRKGAKEKTE